jgi:F0F1-type ATP synthase membrane subunit b/b'
MANKTEVYTYTIEKKHKDPMQAVIAKHGQSIQFTLADIQQLEVTLKKQLKEAEAQAELEKAKMDNIERNHAFVKKLTDEQLFTAHMYAEAKARFTESDKLAKDIKKKFKNHDKEMSEVYKQTGIYPSDYGTETNS